jgi:hypothetical protein
MRITDYEKGTTLRDICISLTIDEADELRIYLNKLVKDPQLSRAHLCEVKGFELEKEITIAVDGSGLSPKAFKAANR